MSAAKRSSPARKAAPATKRPVRKRQTATAGADTTEAASLSELLARLGKLELAGLAGRLVSGWRTDLETIVEANQKSYAGLQHMVARQMAQLKERTNGSRMPRMPASMDGGVGREYVADALLHFKDLNNSCRCMCCCPENQCAEK